MTDENYPSGETMVRRIMRVKDEVEYILRKHPTARGDDRVLIWLYYRDFSGIKISFKQFSDLRAAISSSTIVRRRREIQTELPELRPTERVKIKRERRAEAYKHIYGKGGLTLTDYIEGNPCK